MRFKHFLILGLVVGLLFSSYSFSQHREIKVLSFQEFEPHLFLNNDTTYLVNFWATWCTPCIKELPAFREIEKKYKNDKFKLLMVSFDFPDQIESRLIPVLDKYEFQSESIVLDDPDANKWINKVSPEWSGAIPGTLIYQGNNRKFYEQDFEFHELDSIVNLILKK